MSVCISVIYFFWYTWCECVPLMQKGAKGQDLIDRVCEQADLVEKDYFGLVYVDRENTRNWLAADKKISKQLKSEFVWSALDEKS